MKVCERPSSSARSPGARHVTARHKMAWPPRGSHGPGFSRTHRSANRRQSIARLYQSSWFQAGHTGAGHLAAVIAAAIAVVLATTEQRAHPGKHPLPESRSTGPAEHIAIPHRDHDRPGMPTNQPCGWETSDARSPRVRRRRRTNRASPVHGVSQEAGAHFSWSVLRSSPRVAFRWRACRGHVLVGRLMIPVGDDRLTGDPIEKSAAQVVQANNADATTLFPQVGCGRVCRVPLRGHI